MLFEDKTDRCLLGGEGGGSGGFPKNHGTYQKKTVSNWNACMHRTPQLVAGHCRGGSGGFPKNYETYQKKRSLGSGPSFLDLDLDLYLVDLTFICRL